ncbi:MAG: AsmA family protein [Acidobacteriia bacterium]|nr:AsmA family protein [Terriglobia bacterium]
MKLKLLLKLALGFVLLLLVAGLVAPYLNAGRYGERLRGSLARALGRGVEFRGPVKFSLFKGPGFTVENVVIHEDPSIGIEPMAYVDAMDVRPGAWSLLGGRFVIASILLDGAHINLTKSGAALEPGRWNFASFVNPSVMRTAPAIHVRNSRINFKFGDGKSIFYLTETDLDISPPGSLRAGWSVSCSAKPARTDRSGQGLGSFTLKGKWYVAPERVDLDLVLDRTGLGEMTALASGQTGNVHGTVSSRLHLGGPIHNIGIEGRLTIEDVHRWDLLPPQGQGWPFDIRGRLDLIAQQLELQSNSPGNRPLPLWLRFRASDYLSQPHWAVTANWDRFPVPPLMELARHMGATLPPGLELGGAVDGAIGYSGQSGLQGELALHDASLTIPGSPPLRFEQAHFVFDQGHIHLAPALVLTSGQDQVQVEADYAMDAETLDLALSTEAMAVESLRAQAALAAVPWLEQVHSGQWSGQLRYHRGGAQSGWSGHLELTGAEIPAPGLAEPLLLASARASIDGDRVLVDHIAARAGKVAFTGEFRYEPLAARPHHLRLRSGTVDAADLESAFLPTLRRSTGLIARALGRASVPGWLAERTLDGAVRIDDLLLAGAHWENVRAHLLWDGARVEFDSVKANLDRAVVTGRLAVNLRGPRPAYVFTGRVTGLDWQSGKLEAGGTLETSGTGSQLLANLRSQGTFAGAAVEFGTLAPLRSVTGNYSVAWSQAALRWRLTDLNLRTEDDTYTGHGATQDDGRLVVLLTDGAREIRMSGPLAKLKVEETVRQ